MSRLATALDYPPSPSNYVDMFSPEGLMASRYGRIDNEEYRMTLRRCLECINYHDEVVGKNNGDKEPLQIAVKSYAPLFEQYKGFEIINLFIFDKREAGKPNLKDLPCWGSYTIIYPRRSFMSQAFAIIAAMYQRDRMEKGIKVYMDGHLDKMLENFGARGRGIIEWWENMQIEMSDSFCVLQAPTNDVSDDRKTGRVLGENPIAWACTSLLLSNFFARDYSFAIMAMKKIINDATYIRDYEIKPKIFYKERLPIGKFPLDQPPPPRVALAPPPAKQPAAIYRGPFVPPPK